MIQVVSSLASKFRLAKKSIQPFGCQFSWSRNYVGRQQFPYKFEDKNEVQLDNRIRLDCKIMSRYFFTNWKEATCNFKNPFILILDDNKILKQNVLQFVVESTGYSQPLLVVADDVVEPDVAGSLMMDWTLRGAKFCVVDPFKRLQNRKAIMRDLAIFTGGQVVTEWHNKKLIPQMLGSCKEVRATSGWTIIFGGSGSQADIEERCEQLRSEIKLSSSDYEVKLLMKRLANLCCGTTAIKVLTDSQKWKTN